jgi:hypothetical protein
LQHSWRIHGLLWRVNNELNTLGDVAAEAFIAFHEQLLLVFVGRRDDVEGFLDTVGLKSEN